MVDKPFKIWAFEGSFFPTARTMPDRIRDVFNVKEFGAVGNGSTDDRAAIVAAFQAASNNSGGIVFFPPGRFYVSSKIIPPADTTLNQGWGIIMQGSGGNPGSGGTQIFTDQRDYVLYIGHGGPGGSPVGNGQPNLIRGIFDINFQNTYSSNEAAYIASTAQVTTEPVSSTGYLDGTPGDAGAEGHGCLYLGNIYQCGFRNLNIQFGTGIGICVISGYVMDFNNCNILGGFPHGSTNPAAFTNLYKSIGMWHRGGAFRGTRTEGCGVAIVVTDGPAQIENHDIENSGIGLLCGSKPLKAWNPELLAVRPVDDQARFQLSHVRSLGIEKAVYIGYWIKTGGNAIFNSCHCAGGGLGAQACQYGLKIDNGSNMLFQGLDIGGYIEQAAIDIRGANNCTFRNVAPNNSGPGVAWMLKTDWSGYPSAYGNVIQGCDQTDGGVLVSQLPPGAAGRYYNHQLVVTDSTLPRNSSGTSNAGKLLVGGGTFRVGAQWDGTSWTIA